MGNGLEIFKHNNNYSEMSKSLDVISCIIDLEKGSSALINTLTLFNKLKFLVGGYFSSLGVKYQINGSPQAGGGGELPLILKIINMDLVQLVLSIIPYMVKALLIPIDKFPYLKPTVNISLDILHEGSIEFLSKEEINRLIKERFVNLLYICFGLHELIKHNYPIFSVNISLSASIHSLDSNISLSLNDNEFTEDNFVRFKNVIGFYSVSENLSSYYEFCILGLLKRTDYFVKNTNAGDNVKKSKYYLFKSYKVIPDYLRKNKSSN
jgi:hypothetical protein